MADPERFHDTFFLQSGLKLPEVCARLREEFNVPPFEFDHENENEWAISTGPATLVRVSHAYAPDTFHGWNPLCPPGCDYSVEVKVLLGAPGDWNDAARAAWRESWATTLGELTEGAVHTALGG